MGDDLIAHMTQLPQDLCSGGSNSTLCHFSICELDLWCSPYKLKVKVLITDIRKRVYACIVVGCVAAQPSHTNN